MTSMKRKIICPIVESLFAYDIPKNFVTKIREDYMDRILATATSVEQVESSEKCPIRDVVWALVEALDEEGMAVLYGITGVFRHAIKAKMPAKWQRQIYGDLLDAFGSLADNAHLVSWNHPFWHQRLKIRK